MSYFLTRNMNFYYISIEEVISNRSTMSNEEESQSMRLFYLQQYGWLVFSVMGQWRRTFLTWVKSDFFSFFWLSYQVV